MIYVRKPNQSTREHEIRTLAFRIPPTIPVQTWLNDGFCIDGNSCVREVIAQGVEPFPVELLRAERELVSYLEELGFECDFS